MYILDFLRGHRVWFEPLIHRPASSSAKRAGNAHVPGRKVAKAVLIRAGDAFILAVLPSTSRIDLGRLSQVVLMPASDVRLATPDELNSLFNDCEPGAVPPFGQLYGLRTVVDSDLAENPEIVIGANTRHEGLRMRFRDYELLEKPVRASFAQPIVASPDTLGRPHRDRRAG